MPRPKAPWIRRVRDYFEGKRGVLAVYLFGSQASGRQNSSSDVDLAVLLKRGGPRQTSGQEFKFRCELEGLLHTDVDVTILNHADLFLAHQALTKGVAVFVRDRRRAEQLKWRLVNAYWDFIPTRRILEGESIRRLARY